ncbi:helix-turn-helix domain-containing protein [Herbiconiux sp. CPCC 203407]|uniref:Helix-turn-helix domain-containing protein n=1 Tax=Herbiconiux oxytropis TaxID=2970915 RepID=A0AA42BS92_9MICO|nr:helix-turn-helix domain-containing protein [Herbiconiux oxytropis]MCS5721505.1 helix-turn-helix domain-containing protein [Herbiconiux oxytropis]MCS5724582.1 helix-turn-helix domain-containing protein [Herbiconiux oxytropis]
MRDLLVAHDSAGLTGHHIPSSAQSVRDIALITRVEQILEVGPDSIVLLAEELALGGWVVSVALRYAWERRAVALIVSEQSFSESVIELARRFGVALFTTSDGIDRTALTLARELGALEAGILSRLDALHSRMLRAASIPEVLSEISQELGDALVQLVVDGIVLVSHGTRPAEPVIVRLVLNLRDRGHRGQEGQHGPDLVAAVAPVQQAFADQALARASTTVRALLLQHELDDLVGAAPLLSFAALSGLREDGAFDDSRSEQPALRRLPSGTPVAAVVLRVADVDQRSARIAPVVTSRWREAFPRVPLARLQSGWFALVPLADPADELDDALQQLADSGLGDLGAAVGVAHDPHGTEQVTSLLRRAGLAARLAEPGGPVLDFRRFGLPLLRRLLPAEDALDLALTTYPALLADPHASEIIATVVSYLDCAGSVTAAAEHLGVHRNTVQLRMRHAATLGVTLNHPEQLLSTHLLLSALDLRALPVASSPTAEL